MPVILLVEDDAANIELVRRILERRPEVELQAAGTGRAALSLADENPPQLVLLDMHLPDVSGVEVLEHLAARSETAGVPVVILTGDSGIDRTALGAAGASDFLIKPYDVGQLLEIVDRYVGPTAQ